MNMLCLEYIIVKIALPYKITKTPAMTNSIGFYCRLTDLLIASRMLYNDVGTIGTEYISSFQSN